MRDANPQTIYLKDYTPPEYLVDRVELEFELDADNTLVRSRLSLRKNPENKSNSSELQLHGEHLELVSIRLDQVALNDAQFRLSPTELSIPEVPDEFTLEIENRIHPASNTALEGLFLSKGMLCTQCEAEGFRKITWFPDRPDVMSAYTVKMIADPKRYPVLLSNGNRIDQGSLDDGRHWVTWEDPFKKPSYLFALVAGDLECLRDQFTTLSGREIALEIYVEAHDLDKCEHAMQSLKNAMAWDEQAYGREYDLDLYMIVAVGHFNMGAMENKGLNIFNTKFVLASEQTATDMDYENIEGVIGHEYFHNWSGNRVTCRDWFQLSLKEGFTVFRDQQFTAHQTSEAVKRIQDVILLRSNQFAEDAGPLAHPIRPEAYIEINNFYTLTVYEKGAEVVRMLHTLLGEETFRKGTDLYFERHDGQAVTTEDFVRALEDASGRDLSLFQRWYGQAGTPRLAAESEYDAAKQEYRLTLSQTCPPTPKQPNKPPLHIPVRMGLLDRQGEAIPLKLAGETDTSSTRVLELTDSEQQFTFVDVPEQPVPSLLRGFSAPVILHQSLSPAEYAFLFRHDADPFNRWEAGQTLTGQVILNGVAALQTGQALPDTEPALLVAFEHLLSHPLSDLSYLALLLTLPSMDALSQEMNEIDVDALHTARAHLKQQLGQTFASKWQALYGAHHRLDDGKDADAIGRRRIKNLALSYLVHTGETDEMDRCVSQFDQARNMTDQLAALSELSHLEHVDRTRCLDDFYQQWRSEALVIDKWFMLQATSQRSDTMQDVLRLLAHPDFDLKTPNRVRSLLGAFANANPLHFHAANGEGYQLIADKIIELDAINPQIASRMLGSLSRWRRYNPQRQKLMQAELNRIMARPGISRDVFEVASKSLASEDQV